jgi:hypothetical protein
MSQDLLTKYGFTVGNAADGALLATPVRISALQKTTLASKGIGPRTGFCTGSSQAC